MSRFTEFLGFFLSVFLFSGIPLNSTAQNCEIIFPTGTEDDYQYRSYRNISQSNTSHKEWSGLHNGNVSDDQHIEVNLGPSEFSETICYSGFNFNIPDGAIIHGIKVVLEGNAEGAIPLDNLVRLKNNTNTNLANLAFSGDLWPSDSDGVWGYGASWYAWNSYWNANKINANDFGVEIQLRNTSAADLTAYIDQLKIEVYYTPPYTVCSDHACIIASVSDDPQVSNYNWIVPSDYHFISESSTENLIVISPTGEGLGTHEICVTPNGSGYSQCCKSFTLEDCTPGIIGDYVFDDRNDNGIQDADDFPIEGITISLFDDKSNLVTSTVSNATGFYQFANVKSGDYYIQISNYDNYLLAKADIGNDGSDSDLSEILGIGTTDLFHLNPGQNKSDIDLGLRLLSSIAGEVWLDNNGDGLNDIMEFAMADIVIQLYDHNNQLVANTITDADGSYIFENLLPDIYYVVFVPTGDLVFTNFGMDSDVDNSIVEGSTGLIDAMAENEIVGIDAGVYEYSGLGDFIWYDLNRNGLQDNMESGIPNLQVTLVSNNGTSQQILTNDQGQYEFLNITPGSYTLSIEKNSDLQLTLFNQGNGANDSADLVDIGAVYTTQTITLNSGEVRRDIDFGFQYKPSSINGIAWEDANGNGLNDAGEMQLASIPVGLYTENNILVQETLTDATGSYAFDNLNPGNYYVVFEKTGSYVFTMFGMDSDVNEDIGEGTTNLISLSAGTDIDGIDAGYYEFASIGDYIWLDINRDGIQDSNESGISGLDINLLQASGIIVNNVTDANGIYTYDLLPPGSYIISIHEDNDLTPSPFNEGDGSNDGDELNDVGLYYNSNMITVVSGEVRRDIDFGFQYKPSSINGIAWEDANGNGLNDAGEMQLASIPVGLYTENNILVQETLTDATGSYAFDNVNPGNYYVVFEKTGSYVFTMFGMDSDVNEDIGEGTTNVISLSAGTDIDGIDAGYYEFASIGDYIWLDINRDGIQDSNESGISGLDINLLQASGIIVNNVTDANGIYTYDLLPPGSYIVSIHEDNDLTPSPFNEGDGSNDGDELNDVGLYYNSNMITVVSGEVRRDIDFGFQYKPSSINGMAWEDANGNGLNDAGEMQLASIPVGLYTENNILVQETLTDATGSYAFDNLNPGNYYVVFEKTGSYVFTMFGMDSDVNEDIGEGTTNVISLSAGTDIDGIDAGYYEFASIGDYIWLDINRDGIQDSNESGISGLDINLLQASGIIVNNVTDANGIYTYDLLPPGSYIISIHEDNDLTPSPFNEGDGSNDGDELNDVGLYYNSNMITVVSGEVRRDIDFGFQYKPSSINGIAWEDANGNGLNDAGEMQLASIPVGLYTENNILVQETLTDATGSYAFDNVNPGNYYIVFTNPQGFMFTSFGMDSDVDGMIADGATELINLPPGNNITALNAGLYQYGSIGDYIWNDQNRNGIQDNTEVGVPSLIITLTDAQGNEITTQSDSNGNYEFTQLEPGEYFISLPAIDNFSPTIANQGNGNNDSRLLALMGADFNSNTFLINSGDDRTDLDFGFEINSSFVKGTVWEDSNYNGNNDNGEDLLSGVMVSLFENTLGIVGTTTTDEEGNYTFENLDAGMYYVVFNHVDPFLFTLAGGDSDVVGVIATGATNLFVVMPDTMIGGVDAGYYRKLSLGDFVWEDLNNDGLQGDLEPGIPGVIIRLWELNGTEVDVSMTNSNGQYQFVDVNPGMYQIKLEIDNTYASTLEDQGDGTNDSRSLNSNLTTNSLSFISGQNNNNLDFGFMVLSSSISGNVWYDLDADGEKENGEPSIPGRTVTLFSQGGTQVKTTTTDVNGDYLFDVLEEGDYYIVFENITDVDFTIATIDSDVTGSVVPGSTDVFSLISDQNIVDVNAGYVAYSTIGDYVWFDENGDGLQDVNENGIANIEVLLYNGFGMLIDQVSTEDDGSYRFINVLPTDYYIIFDGGADYLPTIGGAGNGNNDSDITDVFGIGSTGVITVDLLQDRNDVDAGFIEIFATVSGNVFTDVDANGLNQSTDTPLSAVLVELYDTNNTLVKSTNTDAQGNYAFDQLQPSDYYVKFGISNNFILTSPNQGTNDLIDSDITEANGTNTTDVFTLVALGNVGNIDGGVYEYVSIGDQVWIDENEDGINNNNEQGLNRSNGFFIEHKWKYNRNGM